AQYTRAIAARITENSRRIVSSSELLPAAKAAPEHEDGRPLQARHARLLPQAQMQDPRRARHAFIDDWRTFAAPKLTLKIHRGSAHGFAFITSVTRRCLSIIFAARRADRMAPSCQGPIRLRCSPAK